MDTIKGEVVRVLDGKTFELDVTQVGRSNTGTYGNRERIHIAAISEPDLQECSREVLNGVILCRRVRCFVLSRRDDGTIEAQVQVF